MNYESVVRKFDEYDEETRCCSDRYFMGFVTPFIFHIFSLLALIWRKDAGFRRGLIHGLIIVLSLTVLWIVIQVIVIVTYTHHHY